VYEGSATSESVEYVRAISTFHILVVLGYGRLGSLVLEDLSYMLPKSRAPRVPGLEVLLEYEAFRYKCMRP